MASREPFFASSELSPFVPIYLSIPQCARVLELATPPTTNPSRIAVPIFSERRAADRAMRAECDLGTPRTVADLTAEARADGRSC